MKLLFLTLFVFTAPEAFAASKTTFELNCKWQVTTNAPIGAPAYKAVKKAVKKNGKWDAEYSVVATPLNPGAKPIIYKLEPAGSGDEDYNEYDVVDADDSYPIQGASIQNAFKWVSLIDNAGTAAYHCEK